MAMVDRLSIAALCAALTLAACGGSTDSNGVASIDGVSTTTAADAVFDEEQQLLRFAACMRDQGIDLPDPSVDADGNVDLVPPADFDPADIEDLIAAAEACQEFLEGVALGFDDIDLTAITDTLVEFAACMRDNGYDLPDPDFSLIDPDSGSVPTAGPFGNIDLEDDDFLAAFGVCQPLIADLGVPPPPG